MRKFVKVLDLLRGPSDDYVSGAEKSARLAHYYHKPRETPAREVKITGEVEARITQLACSEPPAGHARWTLRLLANHLVEIEVIDSISHQSVGMVLKKVNSNYGGRNVGAFPPSKTPPS